MTTFKSRETVVIKGTIKDEDGILVLPAARPAATRITVLDPTGEAVVDDEAIIFDNTGVYRYLYNPSGDSKDTIGIGAAQFNRSRFNMVRYNEGGGPVAIIPSLGAHHVRVSALDAGPYMTIADSEFLLVD